MGKPLGEKQGDFRLIALFLPILVENILRNTMSTVNVFILGQYSDNAVAAVGVASQVINMVLMFFTLISTGATVVISQNLGAGKKQRAIDAGMVAIAATTVLGVIFGIFTMVNAVWILRLLQLEDVLLSDAVTYLRIASLGSMVQAPLTAMSAICCSNGRAKASMLTMLAMNLLNAAGNFIVIFRPFETPFYGVQGVAVMRVASEFAALTVMILQVHRMHLGMRVERLLPFPKDILRDILKIGVPGGVQSVSYNLSQIVTTAIITVLGVTAVSAKIYVQNINVFVFTAGQSLGQAAAILIGRYVGSEEWNRADRLNRSIFRINIILNGGLGFIMVLLRHRLVGLFTNNHEIIALATSVILIDFFAEIFRGINHTEQFSLQAAGDVKFPMIIGIISCWLVSILFSYLLGIRLGFGLFGCWIAFTMDEVFRGCILTQRWKSRKWIGKDVVRDCVRAVSTDLTCLKAAQK